MINIRSLTFSDFILIIGISMSSMTSLRIWKAGPSEILLLLWSFYIFYKYSLNIEVSYIGCFWLVWTYLITIGMLICLNFYPEQSLPSEIFTYYYYPIITLGLYNGLKRKPLSVVFNLLKLIFLLSGLLFGLLYLYGLVVSKSFFGIPLFYGSVRFTGGANNPHQLALFTGAMFFIGIYLSFQTYSKKTDNIIYLIFTLFFLIISIGTLSSTLIAATVLSLLIGSVFWIKNLPDKFCTAILFSFLSILLLITLYYKLDFLIQYIAEWIANDPNGEGRLILWLSVPDTIKKSVLFGLGPGRHAIGGAIFHNSYLEIFAMSGILGSINFLIFFWHTFKLLNNNTFLFMIFCFLLGYNVAGFAMNRVAFWIVVIFLLAISEKNTISRNPVTKKRILRREKMKTE